jgi:hypothetical protein
MLSATGPVIALTGDLAVCAFPGRIASENAHGSATTMRGWIQPSVVPASVAIYGYMYDVQNGTAAQGS